MAPSFFFMIDQMRESSRITPRQIPGPAGLWGPPRQLGGNRKETGNTTNVLYYFNHLAHPGENYVTTFQTTPQALNLEHYRTMSIYHDNTNSFFWAVPWDATQSKVGTGLQHDSPGTRDARLGHENDQWDDTGNDWELMRFSHDHAGNDNTLYASYVMLGANQHKLCCQRMNQRWAQTLLPNTYWAERERWTPDENLNYGGLIGELNFILALIAFSVKPEKVHDALIHCLYNSAWRAPILSNDRIGRGWEHKRGMVVRIWTGYFPTCTKEAVKTFEEGEMGKIYT